MLLLVTAAAKQSDLSSGFRVCLFVCLAVDKEFHLRYCHQMALFVILTPQSQNEADLHHKC